MNCSNCPKPPPTVTTYCFCRHFKLWATYQLVFQGLLPPTSGAETGLTPFSPYGCRHGYHPSEAWLVKQKALPPRSCNSVFMLWLLFSINLLSIYLSIYLSINFSYKHLWFFSFCSHWTRCSLRRWLVGSSRPRWEPSSGEDNWNGTRWKPA